MQINTTKLCRKLLTESKILKVLQDHCEQDHELALQAVEVAVAELHVHLIPFPQQKCSEQVREFVFRLVAGDGSLRAPCRCAQSASKSKHWKLVS